MLLASDHKKEGKKSKSIIRIEKELMSNLRQRLIWQRRENDS
jgi:hypothetical protein